MSGGAVASRNYAGYRAESKCEKLVLRVAVGRFRDHYRWSASMGVGTARLRLAAAAGNLHFPARFPNNMR